jgi:hypothetical protein
MTNPETPEHKHDLHEARIDWAFSFLTDWVIPLLHDNRLDHPKDLIELRELFSPSGHLNNQGTDFSLHDVLKGALRWRAHNQQLHPNIPEDEMPSGKQLHRAIDLLTAAVQEPPEAENWTQTSFLEDEDLAQ